jgi:hypothetical protein
MNAIREFLDEIGSRVNHDDFITPYTLEFLLSKEALNYVKGCDEFAYRKWAEVKHYEDENYYTLKCETLGYQRNVVIYLTEWNDNFGEENEDYAYITSY